MLAFISMIVYLRSRGTPPPSENRQAMSGSPRCATATAARRKSGETSTSSLDCENPLSGVATTCVESGSQLSSGLGDQHWTIFLLCSTSSPEPLNQVTKQHLLQPSGSLLSVKCSQTSCIPARPFWAWQLLCQTHLLFSGHKDPVEPWHLCPLGGPSLSREIATSLDPVLTA